jgi:hypothetical protein
VTTLSALPTNQVLGAVLVAIAAAVGTLIVQRIAATIRSRRAILDELRATKNALTDSERWVRALLLAMAEAGVKVPDKPEPMGPEFRA